MPELKIGDLIAKIPIIQGGMGVGISLAGLASAVANEGAIGVISSVGIGMVKKRKTADDKNANLEGLREEIQLTRSKTKGIIGLNVMVALTDFLELVQIGFEEQVDIIFMGAGLPISFPQEMVDKYFFNSKTKLGVIVSSERATNLILKTWEKKFNRLPDIVVVEGPKAGGHLGFKKEQIFDNDYSLEVILPKVIEEVKSFEERLNIKIPVIAGGGVYTGEDIYNIMKLGASGVQMGTRFVATEECDATDEFKQHYVDCQEDDIVIIQSPVGLPGRALNNDFLKGVKAGVKTPFKCPWKCLKTCDYTKSPYCIAIALTNARWGLLSHGFAFCGSNAYRVDKIVTVKQLIEELKEGFYKAVQNYGDLAVPATN
ncbi:MAG: nitronate monooxygenase [Candidatus Cloacimonetes bacterium]|nr:nitronate monooxygenase [Candidatus Cloacimonadota bacterium]